MRRLVLLALALPAAASAQSVTFPGLLDGRAYASETQMQMAQTMQLSVAGQTQEMTMTQSMDGFQTMQAARTAEGWTLTTTVQRLVSRAESPMTGAVVMDTDRPDALPAEQRDELMGMVGTHRVIRLDPSFRLREPVSASASGMEMQVSQMGLLAGLRTVGEAWTDTLTMAFAGVPNEVVMTYTLREVVGDSARLTYTQTYRGEGPIRAPGVPETMETSLTLTGTGEGVAHVHLGNGGSRTIGTATMQGVMEMRGAGLETPMTMGIGMEMRSAQTVRARD